MPQVVEIAAFQELYKNGRILIASCGTYMAHIL
jgi:hypothetical protein